MTRPLRVLVGCEMSGRVRDAFIAAGHDAVSCDIVPSVSDSGPHIVGDVREVLHDGWDLGIFHPPCTYLAKVSAPALSRDPERKRHLIKAVDFFLDCLNAPIPRVAVENPGMLGVAMRLIGERPAQWIEPHQFGHPFTKKTGLWLRNLPPLNPTDLVEPSHGSWTERARRAADRSLTFPGIASAMADQWPAAVSASPAPLFDWGAVA